MSNVSHYSIKVAERIEPLSGAAPRYAHFCRIELSESKANEAVALRKLADVRERFPAPDFSVTMTYWDTKGHTVG